MKRGRISWLVSAALLLGATAATAQPLPCASVSPEAREYVRSRGACRDVKTAPRPRKSTQSKSGASGTPDFRAPEPVGTAVIGRSSRTLPARWPSSKSNELKRPALPQPVKCLRRTLHPPLSAAQGARSSCRYRTARLPALRARIRSRRRPLRLQPRPRRRPQRALRPHRRPSLCRLKSQSIRPQHAVNFRPHSRPSLRSSSARALRSGCCPAHS